MTPGVFDDSGLPAPSNKVGRIPFGRGLSIFSNDRETGERITASDTTLPPLTQTTDGKFIRPRDNVRQYLRHELDVSRLNRIHKHLWLAGLPRGARPLHRQLLLDRQIVVSEQADLHMVWQKTRIFIKPLPLFLLQEQYWHEHICIEDGLYRDACGFLLSYAWLISAKSDLDIAHRLGLIPQEISWPDWVDIIEDFLDHIDLHSPNAINSRYRFGELRLTRLNWIYRCTFWQTGLRGFQRGFFRGPDWYSQFIRNNFGWFIAVFAYITIVLSAMQVGLGVNSLTSNDRFQNASYGFTVFAIVMPVIVVGIMLATSAIVVFLSVRSTQRYNHRVEKDPGPYVGAAEGVR